MKRFVVVTVASVVTVAVFPSSKFLYLVVL